MYGSEKVNVFLIFLGQLGYIVLGQINYLFFEKKMILAFFGREK